jgi:uncharacterized membrane protein (DUF106 family)
VEALSLIDGFFAGMLSPLLRAVVWGVLTAAVSMGIYVLIAPQEKLRLVKAEQKANKAKLKAYDGDFEGMSVLIKQDLRCSLKMVTLSLVPFVVSMAPAIALMYGLEDVYANVPFPSLGAEWTENFEFWFLLAAIVVSLAIKVIFKIA